VLKHTAQFSTRQDLQPCFILHQKPFKESSVILDVFSQNQGRLSILARGAKRPKSTLKNRLHPFALLLLSWTGKHDLKILIDAQIEGGPYSLYGMTLFCALYINELLIKSLSNEDPYVSLFHYYNIALKSLVNANNDINQIKKILRIFEAQLLTELGYAIDLNQIADPKRELRMALQRILGDKTIHSRNLVRKLLVDSE